MFWCAFIALLYVIAGIVVATIAKDQAIYGAAAVNAHSKKKINKNFEILFSSFLLLQLF